MSSIETAQRIHDARPESSAAHAASRRNRQASRRRRPQHIRSLQLLLWGDCVAFCAALTIALLVSAFQRAGIVPRTPVSAVNALFAFACVAGYACAAGLHERRVPFWDEVRTVLRLAALGLLGNGFLDFIVGALGAQVTVVLAWTLFPAAALATRGGLRSLLRRHGKWALPTLVVGRGPAAEQAAAALQSEPALGYTVLAVVGPEALEGQPSGATGRRLLRRHGAEILVLAFNSGDRPHKRLLEGLVRERVRFAVMPPLDGLPALGCEQTAFFSHDTVLLSYRNSLDRPVARAAKVAFDVAAAAALLLFLSPVFLAIAALVKLDGGPAFFVHPRVGAGNRRFGCLKFRSMVRDADAVLARHLAADPAAAAEWAATQKLRDDPRVTWVGRLLRKTSLDELPQLLNVLRLEMSLVGPRPIVAREVAKYAEDIVFYHETRPGLTGLWQVSGRSDTSYAQRVQLDCWYVKNWTLWHDVAILAKTVPAVLKRHGAV